MRKRERNLRALWTLAILSFTLSTPAFSADEAVKEPLPGYSQSKVKKIQPRWGSKASNACAEFEATYNGQMKSAPRAVVDVERHNMLDGVLSALMKVIPLGSDRYRLQVEDPEICNAMREKGRGVYVTVEEGTGTDDRPSLPEQGYFFAGRNMPLPK